MSFRGMSSGFVRDPGLAVKQGRLNNGIFQIKQVLVAKFTTDEPDHQELNRRIEKAYKSGSKVKIAGHTTEFVNRVLEKVKSGAPIGPLEEL
uniref:Uncharacterized protein n=1 Tax=Timema douglasi TaxID=61478 RepID=A0A7R8ZC06_TIMDO|nr:unnamed protein product [Timema douglasi]